MAGANIDAAPTPEDRRNEHRYGPNVAPHNRPMLDRYRLTANLSVRGLSIDGRPALTGIDPALIGDYVMLVVRDPLCDYRTDPAEQIAEHLAGARLAGRTGMFATYTGTYRGAEISVVSGGSGAPEAELALFDLLEFSQASVYLRVGGAGGMHPDVEPGDLVIAEGVVRDDGMTASYVPPSYPAASSPDLVLALVDAAAASSRRFHCGIVRSADSDYVGAGRPSVTGYLQPWHLDLVDSWTRAGVLCSDRESSAIVTLARLFGKRGGSICSVADNISTGAPFASGAGHEGAIQVALEGLARLSRMDARAMAAGAMRWTPALGVDAVEG